jgi:hypothetical protein
VDAAGEAGLAMSSGGMPAAVPRDSPTMLPARLWFVSPPNAVGDSNVVTAESAETVALKPSLQLHTKMGRTWFQPSSASCVSRKLAQHAPDVSCSSMSRSDRLCNKIGCGSKLWTYSQM